MPAKLNPVIGLADTAADIAALPACDVIALAGYHRPADGGGGLLWLDPDDAGPGDGMVTFPCPSVVGRFRRGIGQALRAAEAGLRESRMLDQSRRAQDFLDICTFHNWTAVLDVKTVSCAGGEIWWNSGGNPNGVALPAGHLRGEKRRDSRLVECDLHVGNRNSLRTAASTNISIENLHLEGALSVYNVEGAPRMVACSFEPSPAMRDNGIYAARGTTEIVSLIACNHPTMDTCMVQEGDTCGLGGMRCSQIGNLLLTSGRFSRNEYGILYARHATLATSASHKFAVDGTHFEANRREAIILGNVDCVSIDGHLRGSPPSTGHAWDTDFPLIRIAERRTRHVTVGDSEFYGVGADAGTAILAEAGDGIFVNGLYSGFKTIADIRAPVRNYRLGDITSERIGVGTPFLVDPAATRYGAP